MNDQQNSSRLLVFKSGSDYLRLKDGTITRCALFQASVFPEAQLAEVLALRQPVLASYPDACLRLLCLSESAYPGGEQ